MKFTFFPKLDFSLTMIWGCVLSNIVLLAFLFWADLFGKVDGLSTGRGPLFVAVAISLCAIYFILEFIVNIPNSHASIARLALASVLLIGVIILSYANIYSQIYELYGTDAFKSGSLSAGDFLYYSITTFTATGYGDITSISAVSNGFAASEMLIGFLLNSILIAVVAWKLLQSKKDE
ncbi:MAG TPA: potassium channel family protein [Bacilli bacterium]